MDRCDHCGSADIDHGAEHMGSVEFPESICQRCFELRAASGDDRTCRGSGVVLGADGWIACPGCAACAW
jgi:hypothetical protein